MNIGELKTAFVRQLRGGSTSTHEPDSDNADVGIDSKSVIAPFCAFEKVLQFILENLFYDMLKNYTIAASEPRAHF